MNIHKTIDTAKALNVRTTLMAVLLGLSVSANLVQSVLLMNAREIVLAPTLPDNVTLKPGGAVDPKYLEQVAREAAYTFLNRTPETDRYFERAMEQILDPATYQKIKAEMVDDRKVREANRSSQAMFIDDVFVDAGKLYVEVGGNLEISRGTDIVESSRKIYAMRFVRRGSSVLLSSIGEIKPEAAEGQKIKVAQGGER